jgi:hypothetical protein
VVIFRIEFLCTNENTSSPLTAGILAQLAKRRPSDTNGICAAATPLRRLYRHGTVNEFEFQPLKQW